MGVSQGTSVIASSGEMKYHLGIGTVNDVDKFGSLDIDPDRRELARALFADTQCSGQIVQITGGQVVDTNHLMTIRQEAVNEVGTNEPGRTGDQGPHLNSPGQSLVGQRRRASLRRLRQLSNEPSSVTTQLS